MNLTPLLVQPEDMGWPANSYFESEERYPPETEIIPEAMARAGIGPDPLPLRRTSNVSPFRTSQSVWVYADEFMATQNFDFMAARYEDIFQAKGFSLTLPELTNSWWSCIQGLYSMQDGSYSQCFVLAQKENILVRAIMPVNDQIVTMEDWNNYVTQIHRRLVAYEPDSVAP